MRYAFYLLTLSLSLMAQRPPQRPDSFSLGLAAGDQSDVYKGGNTIIPVLPNISIRYKRFRFQGITARYKIYSSWPSVSLLLSPHFLNLEDEGGFTSGLIERKMTLHGGLRIDLPTPWFFFSLSGVYDLLGRHKSFVPSWSFSKFIQLKKFMLIPQLFGRYYSSEFTNYYFGVSQSEARPNRPFYQGEKAQEFGLGMIASYPVSKKWSASLGGSYSRFSEEIYASPLTKNKYRYRWFLGLSYELFKRTMPKKENTRIIK